MALHHDIAWIMVGIVSQTDYTWDVAVSAAADVLETDMSSGVIIIIH